MMDCQLMNHLQLFRPGINVDNDFGQVGDLVKQGVAQLFGDVIIPARTDG